MSRLLNATRTPLRTKPPGLPRYGQLPRGLQLCAPLVTGAYTDIMNRRAPNIGSAVAFAASPYGSGAKFNNSTSNNFLTWKTDQPAKCSLEVLVYTGSKTTNTVFASWNDNTTGSNSTCDRTLGINGSSQFVWYIFDGANKQATDTGTTIAANTLYHLVGVSDGANILLYVNGVLKATTAATAAFSGFTAATVSIALGGQFETVGITGSPSAVVANDSNTLLLNYANVPWSASEVWARYADPFGFLNWSDDGFAPFINTAGASGALTGTSAATTTVTGTLTGAGALTGTSAATTTVSATLTGAGALTATSAATSTVTGTLSGAGALTSTCAATSTVTGTLHDAASFSGTSAATSTVSGTLSAIGALIGSSAITSSVSGTLHDANTSNIWTPVTPASGTWSATSSASGTWTPTTPASGTWSPI